MTLLKIGSKGEEIKKVQRALGITVDGDFGPKTEAAVKEFQKKNKIYPDGMVGPKTWPLINKVLENMSSTTTTSASTNSKVVDPSVKYSPLKCCLTKSTGRKIKYLVIHYTAGASSSPGRAIGMKSSWEKKRSASADFGVDDATMVQFNPDPKNYYCWAVGGGHGITNANSISIEICSNLRKGANASKANHEGWYYTEASLNNAVKLAKILMKKFNIDLAHVVRHYDVTGKLCPGIIGWNKGPLYDIKGNKISGVSNNDNEWKKFKERLK